jgi:hypothetical protein
LYIHGYGPLEPVELTLIQKPDDSAYEYGDVLNGINNVSAIPLLLALLTGPPAF